jgi:hypothetical protein
MRSPEVAYVFNDSAAMRWKLSFWSRYIPPRAPG